MPLWTRWIVNVMAGPGSSEEDTARSRNAAARSSPSLAWKAFSLERMEGNDEHDRVLGLCSGHARGFQQGRYIALDIKPKISKFMRHEGLSSRPPTLPPPLGQGSFQARRFESNWVKFGFVCSGRAISGRRDTSGFSQR